MNNIRGIVDIHFVKDGVTTHFSTEENDICWASWKWLMSYRQGSGSISQTYFFPTKRDATSQITASTDAWYIFYGSKPLKKTPLNNWYLEDATLKVNQDTPAWTSGATVNDNDVVTFSVNIPAPVGSSRTIRVIGLSTPTLNVYQKFTLLPLNTPCIQDTGTTIILTYRLILPPAQTAAGNGYSIAIWNEVRDLFKRACDSVASTYIVYRANNSIISSSSYDFTNLYNITESFGHRGAYSSNGLVGDNQELTDSGVQTSNVAISVYTNAIKYSGTFNTTQAPSTGCFAKTLILGGLGGSGYNSYNISSTQMYKSTLPSVTNPLQNIFKQRNSPPGPFQDAATTGLMTGTINLDYANWVDPELQKLFKININTTGDNTTAAYTVDVMNYTGGFAGNKWIARTSLLPQMCTSASYCYIKRATTETIYESYMNYGGTTYRSPDGYRYVAAMDCQRTAAGIIIYDIISGTKRIYNVSSSSPLPVTAVSDGECAKGYVFVTCANTGLYRINPSTGVVESIASPTGTNKAYQICVKNDANNTIWVLFEGGLCKLNISPDSGTILTSDWTVHNSSSGSPTFTFTGITDGNWQYVTSMTIDPDNGSDNRFLFQRSNIGSISNGFRIGWVWWCTSTGVAANPTTNGSGYPVFTWNQTELLKISDSIKCIDGYWWVGLTTPASPTYQMHTFTYGANAFSTNVVGYSASQNSPRMIRAAVNGVNGGMITHCGVGGGYTGSFFVSSTLQGAIGTNITPTSSFLEFPLKSGTITNTATIETSTNIATGILRAPLVYLPNSNLIFSYEVFTDFASYGVTPLLLPPTHSKYATYKGAFWKSYGWNGSAWVLGNTNSKTAHASLNDLPGLDGLRISFSNGVSGTSFISGEWFITTIGKGLLKDNGTSYTYNLTWDLGPTEKITLNDTVPASAPGLLTNEPLTFSPFQDDTSLVVATSNRICQNKGIMVSNGSGNGSSGTSMQMISDQLIPASTNFTVKFKWISFTGTGTTKSIGLATGTNTLAFFFRYNATSDAVELVETSTVRATIATASLDITKEFKIERVGSSITAYYDNVSLYSITNTSQYVVMTQSSNSQSETGWYDMTITYTENRKILRIGSSGSLTGSYSSRFMGLSTSSVVNDTVVYLGSGTPVLATLDFTTAGSAVPATGTVKVASGAGWLVFHASETAIPVTGYTIAHYVLSGM